MPSVSLPAIGAAAGLAGAGAQIGGQIFGGGSSTPGGGVSGQPQGAQTYVPQYQPFADQLFGNTISSLAGAGTGIGPYLSNQYQSIYDQIGGNPYYGNAVATTAGLAGAPTDQAFSNAFNAGQGLYGGGSAALGLINPIIQSAFDPQKALYDQTIGDLTNQLNSTNAQYGLAGSPAGAGVAGDALSQFNIDWQNNLLGRQTTGANAVGNLITAGGRGYAGGADLQQQGITSAMGNAQAPYNFTTGAYGTDLKALQALTAGTSQVPGTGAYGNLQSFLSPLESYLKLGQSASSTAGTGQASSFLQQQQIGQNLATALNNPSLNQLFGLGGGGTSGGSYGGQQFFGQPGVNTGATSYAGYSFGPLH